MRRPGARGASLLLAASLAPTTAWGAAEHVHHSLKIHLDPERGWLEVTDTLKIPSAEARDGEAQLLLSDALKVTSSEPAVRRIPLAAGDGSGDLGTGGPAAAPDEQARLTRYAVALPPDATVRLAYQGHFDFGLSEQKEEYTRGFRDSAGIVSKEGLYLPGGGYWYPQLGAGLVEYDLEVTVPEGWQVVGSGNGTSRDAGGVARWSSGGAIDEITLVGGPLVVYRDAAGAVESLVYLREKDDALAGRYLQATAQYVEMYRDLIGPYPYAKFALVENFWETGLGMASYTLLGPQVIRFPFILTSSYPHEILHNWWGNSVFVEDAGGNWCEGLTAYMADHLLQEQRGRGEDYRRDALQKYRSYVGEGRDFPLREFRSRHSAATEAVGYGKALMVFHMLRRRLGDDTFREWAARFYRQYRGKRASFVDVRDSLAAVSGRDLGRFFDDHVGRPGAARLEVKVEHGGAAAAGPPYEVTGILEQAQAGPPLELDVPLVLQTAAKPVEVTVRSTAAQTPFSIRAAARPLALHVDPSFDLFRLLDPREIPPSIGQIFGESRILAVLPARAPAAEVAAYRALVEGWRSESHQPELVSDAAVGALPPDRAAWLLGRTNGLAARLFAGGGGDFVLDDKELTVAGQAVPLAGHSVVLVRRHPDDASRAVGWIFADPVVAVPGLGRKLPHYGKYSYLAFEGEEPVNVLKGQWAAGDSPLRVDLRSAGDRATPLPALSPPARKALAELPPVFSLKALVDHVAWLSAPPREGRGVGTKGLEAAAEYIAADFAAAGLKPGGDGGTYFQAFTSARSPSGTPATLRNVIGVLPGTKAAFAGQVALLTAHYDHLGFGWPDVHHGDEGRLHPGADDNASGVAVLLELGRVLAAGEGPSRTIVFVAFSGEEEGLLGSRHYVQHPVFPLARTIGVVNLDTVGRLFDRKVEVIGAGTASEWPHIFRGVGFVTGVEARMIPEALEASDQKSFVDAGVPAVQVFTGAHADYHRPGDTADKIDGPGLVKVAALAKEAIVYLGERPEPLTSTIAPALAGAPVARRSEGQGRRVSFGTVPDFAFEGPGVRVSGLTPGSPAEKAGVQAGDVILKVAGKDVTDLRSFSEILRGLSPGQTVHVVLARGGQPTELDLTVVER